MHSVELAVSVPGLRAYRSTADSLRVGVKQTYAVGRIERGRSEWWARGKVWRGEPGSIEVKEPGLQSVDAAYVARFASAAQGRPARPVALPFVVRPVSGLRRSGSNRK